MPKEYFRLLLAFLVVCLIACNHKTKTISFYYWRATYAPDSTELKALEQNEVHTLYIHYFDVDWPDTEAAPAAASPIRFDVPPAGYAVVPVIFFNSRVFEKLDSPTSHALAEKVLALVRRIDLSAHLQPAELQFDCDWNEVSRDSYFRFIREYHALSGVTLSSTIRLPQIKNSKRTGIPPVDHGTLLFYNTDAIDTEAANAVYDRATAHRYTASLRNYPLVLDLALPIHQHLTADDLFEMVDDVNQHSSQKIHNLIFFDLDRRNLRQYDNNLFKKVLEHIE